MTIDIDTDPHQTQGAHWKGQTKICSFLRNRIRRYVAHVGTAGAATALELLNETREVLATHKEFDDDRVKTAGQKTPDLDATLKAIHSSLAPIKGKEGLTPVLKNHAAAAAHLNSNPSGPGTLQKQPSHQEPKPTQALKNKASTPKEARRSKEITVRIGNEVHKQKIRLLPTKDLVEALQAETVAIQKVAHGAITNRV